MLAIHNTRLTYMTKNIGLVAAFIICRACLPCNENSKIDWAMQAEKDHHDGAGKHLGLVSWIIHTLSMEILDQNVHFLNQQNINLQIIVCG